MCVYNEVVSWVVTSTVYKSPGYELNISCLLEGTAYQVKENEV